MTSFGSDDLARHFQLVAMKVVIRQFNDWFRSSLTLIDGEIEVDVMGIEW